MSENKSMTTSPSNANLASPDAGMDLAAIMAGQQKKQQEAEETQKKAEEKKKETEKKKTPLEELREKQMNGEGKGIVYNDDELELKSPRKTLRNNIESDDRIAAFEESIKESDEKLHKRGAVVLIKRPTDPSEYIAVETELDAVEFDDQGKAYFNYHTTTITGEDVEVTPEWFIIRTPEYGPYNEDTEKLYSLGKTPEEVKQIMAVKEAEGTTVETAMNDVETKKPEKVETVDGEVEGEGTNAGNKKLVQILIDKTGYGGANIAFTEDEEKKIVEADKIMVTSVRKLDMRGMKIHPSNADHQPPRSFLQVAREHQLADSHADVAFAVTGFRAQMRGLTYGELSDITVDPEGTNFDQVNKQCTVVYNAMISNNRPQPYKDYEDFLKGFSFYDLDMAIYGLYVATFPDTQYTDLRCGRKSCGKSFQKAYTTRSALRIDEAYEGWVNNYGDVVMAQPYEVPTVFDNAPFQTPQYYELPYSKYVIEISPASLYDYLYNVLPLSSEEEFTKLFGPADQITESLREAIDTVGVIRRIMVPDGDDGEYIEFTSVKDIVDAVMSLSPDESRIVRSLAYQYLRTWTPIFGIPDIECPHCHAKTPLIALNITQMVFRAHEQQQNTTIDVTSLLQI